MPSTNRQKPILFMLLGASALLLAGCSSTPTLTSPAGSAAARPAESAPAYDYRQERRRQVVDKALQQLGAPYRYGGNGPHGFDCSGLVQYSHAAAGIRIPRVTWQQRRQARPVSISHLQPGDLLFFEVDRKGRHVGIYLGNGEFIHAPSSGKRVSIASLEQGYWPQHFVAAGSYL